MLGELLPPEQAAIAERALAAMEGASPDLVTELAQRAGDRPRAVAALVAVAKGALSRGAITSARGALERAARLARSRPELASLSRRRAPMPPPWPAKWTRPSAGPPSSWPSFRPVRGRPSVGPASTLTLARAAGVAGRWSDASRHVDDAISLAGSGDRATWAAGQALAAHVALGEGRLDDARVLAESAVPLARPAGAPAAACEALEVLGRLARLVDVDEAERRFAEALAVADHHTWPFGGLGPSTSSALSTCTPVAPATAWSWPGPLPWTPGRCRPSRCVTCT